MGVWAYGWFFLPYSHTPTPKGKVTYMKLGIGLYGTNGHQIDHSLVDNPRVKLVALAAYDEKYLPEVFKNDTGIRRYATLDEMLANDEVQIVSLCSSRRRDQAQDSIRCLRAGKHAYAEKPCAMTEEDLDALLEAAKSSGVVFREMGGTAFVQPFITIREIVQAGTIGEVIQVFAQKSYPNFESRPQDEDIDGGLTMQAGIHGVRMIENAACQRISEVRAFETQLCNPHPGELRIATSCMMRLENGGVATMLANYLNPKDGFGFWGNDQLRVFGTQGMVEAVDGATRTRLVLRDKDCGPLDLSAPGLDYLNAFFDEIEGKPTMPLSLEEELHSTRVVIQARESARS